MPNRECEKRPILGGGLGGGLVPFPHCPPHRNPLESLVISEPLPLVDRNIGPVHRQIQHARPHRRQALRHPLSRTSRACATRRLTAPTWRSRARLLSASEVTAPRGYQRSTRSLTASVLETLPDAMFVIDQRGSVQYFSTAAERLFVYSADEVRGQNVKMRIPSPYRERYQTTRERRIIGIGRVVVSPAQGRQHLPDRALGR